MSTAPIQNQTNISPGISFFETAGTTSIPSTIGPNPVTGSLVVLATAASVPAGNSMAFQPIGATSTLSVYKDGDVGPITTTKMIVTAGQGLATNASAIFGSNTQTKIDAVNIAMNSISTNTATTQTLNGRPLNSFGSVQFGVASTGATSSTIVTLNPPALNTSYGVALTSQTRPLAKLYASTLSVSTFMVSSSPAVNNTFAWIANLSQ